MTISCLIHIIKEVNILHSFKEVFTANIIYINDAANSPPHLHQMVETLLQKIKSTW